MTPIIDLHLLIQRRFLSVKYKIFFEQALSAKSRHGVVWPRMSEGTPGQSVVQVLVPQLPDVVAEAGLPPCSVGKAGPVLIKAGLPRLHQSSVALLLYGLIQCIKSLNSCSINNVGHQAVPLTWRTQSHSYSRPVVVVAVAHSPGQGHHQKHKHCLRHGPPPPPLESPG